MTTSNTLDKFIIRDKFSLSDEAIFDEAQASATRRAEMMGWTDVVAVRSSDPVFKDGEFMCHTFNLVAFNSSAKSENESQSSNATSDSKSGVAARGADADSSNL